MKALGFFAEPGPRFADLPALADLAGKLDPAAESAVLQYLQNGTAFFDVMEATPDPLRPGQSIPGGSSLSTDGVWVWRLDLANYISAYRLELPEEFISRARVAVGSRSFPDVPLTDDLMARALAAAG